MKYLPLLMVLISGLALCGENASTTDSVSDIEKALNEALLRRASTYRDGYGVDSAVNVCILCNIPAQTLYLDHKGVITFYCLAHYPKDK